MGPVGLIDNKGHPVGMADVRNVSDVRDNALIGGTCQDDAGTLRMGGQAPFHILRADAPRDLPVCILLWHQPVHGKIQELNRMIDALVAVPGRKDLRAFFAQARMAARFPTVEPPTRYQVLFA